LSSLPPFVPKSILAVISDLFLLKPFLENR
jgi:hypothetical protein